MTTRKLHNGIRYRVGRKYCCVFIGGKRHNIPVELIRGDLPLCSTEAAEIHNTKFNHLDICYYVTDERTIKEISELTEWGKITPKKVMNFLMSHTLYEKQN